MTAAQSNPPKKPLETAVIITFIVSVCLYVLRMLYVFPGMNNEIQGQTISVSQAADMKGVQVFIITDKKNLGPEENLQLSVRFNNGSDSDLTAVIQGFDQPGFKFKGEPASTFPVGKGSSVEVAPLILSPSTDRGRFRLTLSYVITEKSGKIHAGLLSSAIIQIRAPEAVRRERFLRRVVGLLKDLTLPIFLAGLGLWFQRNQSIRDSQTKILQTARENEAREKSDMASRRQEIWQTILPRFYQLSQEHYLPIVRSLILVDRFRLKNTSKATKEQIDRLLFEFLFLLVRMNLLRHQQGQIFFRSRKGEQVVSLAWKVVYLGSERALTRTAIDESLELIDANASYLSFSRALRIKKPLHEMRRRFIEWLDDPKVDQAFDRYAEMVPIMRAILHLEANRPFDQYWYESSSEIALTPIDPDKYPLGSECAEDVASLKTALVSYLHEMTEYARNFGKTP